MVNWVREYILNYNPKTGYNIEKVNFHYLIVRNYLLVGIVIERYCNIDREVCYKALGLQEIRLIEKNKISKFN